jgi:hypothetical protein
MGYTKGILYKWDLETLEQITKINLGRGYESLVISHDDKFIISCFYTKNELTLFDTQTD